MFSRFLFSKKRKAFPPIAAHQHKKEGPHIDPIEAKNIPPLMLAYIGDAVYELAVREHLLHSGMVKMDRLHSAAVAYVNASRQSQLWGEIEAFLSPEQREVFRRGRNAKSGHQPPHSTVGEYRRATGLEALIGYLHLTGDQAQLERNFATLFQAEEEASLPETASHS